MRPAAQVDELTLAIQRQVLFRGNALDDLSLVRFADTAKELGRLVALPYFALYGLVAVDNILHTRFDCFEIGFREWLFTRKVIVETVLDGGADGHLGIGP